MFPFALKNEALRKFKIIFVACIIFLLDSSGLQRRRKMASKKSQRTRRQLVPQSVNKEFLNIYCELEVSQEAIDPDLKELAL